MAVRSWSSTALVVLVSTGCISGHERLIKVIPIAGAVGIPREVSGVRIFFVDAPAEPCEEVATIQIVAGLGDEAEAILVDVRARAAKVGASTLTLGPFGSVSRVAIQEKWNGPDEHISYTAVELNARALRCKVTQ